MTGFNSDGLWCVALAKSSSGCGFEKGALRRCWIGALSCVSTVLVAVPSVADAQVSRIIDHIGAQAAPEKMGQAPAGPSHQNVTYCAPTRLPSDPQICQKLWYDEASAKYVPDASANADPNQHKADIAASLDAAEAHLPGSADTSHVVPASSLQPGEPQSDSGDHRRESLSTADAIANAYNAVIARVTPNALAGDAAAYSDRPEARGLGSVGPRTPFDLSHVTSVKSGEPDPYLGSGRESIQSADVVANAYAAAVADLNAAADFAMSKINSSRTSTDAIPREPGMGMNPDYDSIGAATRQSADAANMASAAGYVDTLSRGAILSPVRPKAVNSTKSGSQATTSVTAVLGTSTSTPKASVGPVCLAYGRTFNDIAGPGHGWQTGCIKWSN